MLPDVTFDVIESFGVLIGDSGTSMSSEARFFFSSDEARGGEGGITASLGDSTDV